LQAGLKTRLYRIGNAASVAAGFQTRPSRHRNDYDSVAGLVGYIIDNPIRAGLVDDVRRYEYLGSSRYSLAELANVVIDWRPPWKSRR
jgi:hypothetical protein